MENQFKFILLILLMRLVVSVIIIVLSLKGIVYGGNPSDTLSLCLGVYFLTSFVKDFNKLF